MRQRGEALGAEFRGKGVNVALGPMMYVYQTSVPEWFILVHIDDCSTGIL